MLIVTLSMLWNLPFVEWVLSNQRAANWKRASAGVVKFSSAGLPLVITKGNRNIHAIRDRLRQLKQRVCGPAC